MSLLSSSRWSSPGQHDVPSNTAVSTSDRVTIGRAQLPALHCGHTLMTAAYAAGFPQVLQTNAVMMPQLLHDCLLPHAFQFPSRHPVNAHFKSYFAFALSVSNPWFVSLRQISFCQRYYIKKSDMDEECSTHDGWKYRTNVCSKNLKRRIYSRRRRLEDNIKTGVSKAACYCVSWLKLYSGGLYGKWQTSDRCALLLQRGQFCCADPWTSLLCRSVCRKLRPQWFAASWNWCASSWTNHYIAYADSQFRTSRVENVSYKANGYALF